MARITENGLTRELTRRNPNCHINHRIAGWVVDAFGDLDGKVNSEMVPEYIEAYRSGSRDGLAIQQAFAERFKKQNPGKSVPIFGRVAGAFNDAIVELGDFA